MKAEYRKVREYIETHWDGSVADPTRPRSGVFSLPYPFVTPSDAGVFNGVLYYWDTFFANRGLILSGRVRQAQNSVDDFFALIDRLGFVPNYSTPDGAYRSQPPLLAWMVRDIFAATGDEDFLRRAYAQLTKEYAFWQRERSTPTGLARYYHTAPEEYLNEFGHGIQARLGLALPENENRAFAVDKLAEAESGWDFNPRYGGHCTQFAPVDLNAILYSVENLMRSWAKRLATGEDELWQARADARRTAMRKLMTNEQGVYYDYDFVHGCRSAVLSAAAFLPLLAGLAAPEEAEGLVRSALPQLEYPFGIAACAPANPPRQDGAVYQWDYPNGWAPLQYFAVEGLLRYGFAAQARRVAEKYLAVVTAQWQATGVLWEKYNVAEGSLKVSDEYKMPVMLGWTAGVYLHFLDRFEKE